MIPAAGLGNPWKYVFAVPACSMLNRASRMTAQAENRKTESQSQLCLVEHGEVHDQPGREPEGDRVHERVELLAELGSGIRRAGHLPVEGIARAAEQHVHAGLDEVLP